MNATFWKQVAQTETMQAEMKRSEQKRALDRYMAHTERARAAAETIMRWLEDHGEVAPDDVTWANVGTMAHIANDLEEIAAQIRG